LFIFLIDFALGIVFSEIEKVFLKLSLRIIIFDIGLRGRRLSINGWGRSSSHGLTLMCQSNMRVELLQGKCTELFVIDKDAIPFLGNILRASEDMGLTILLTGVLHFDQSRVSGLAHVNAARLLWVDRVGFEIIAKGIKVTIWETLGTLGGSSSSRWLAIVLACFQGTPERSSDINLVNAVKWHPR
jgi:hypothetical protein